MEALPHPRFQPPKPLHIHSSLPLTATMASMTMSARPAMRSTMAAAPARSFRAPRVQPRPQFRAMATPQVRAEVRGALHRLGVIESWVRFWKHECVVSKLRTQSEVVNAIYVIVTRKLASCNSLTHQSRTHHMHTGSILRTAHLPLKLI